MLLYICVGNGPGGPKFMVKVQRLMFSSQIHLAVREEFSFPQMPLCNPPQVLSPSLSFSLFLNTPNCLLCFHVPCLYGPCLCLYLGQGQTSQEIEREKVRKGRFLPKFSLLSLSISLSIYLYTHFYFSPLSLLSLYISFFGPFSVHCLSSTLVLPPL